VRLADFVTAFPTGISAATTLVPNAEDVDRLRLTPDIDGVADFFANVVLQWVKSLLERVSM
jgi:hypothetical protein